MKQEHLKKTKMEPSGAHSNNTKNLLYSIFLFYGWI